MEGSSLSANKRFGQECSPGIREEGRDPSQLYQIAVVLLFIRGVEGGVTPDGGSTEGSGSRASAPMREESRLAGAGGSLPATAQYSVPYLAPPTQAPFFLLASS